VFSLALKILGPIALMAALFGMWKVHENNDEQAIKDAFEDGQEEVMMRWRESDRIAKAIGDEKTKLLKQGATRNETELQRRLASADTRAASMASARATSDSELNRLRIAIDERSATPTPPSSDTTVATCRVDDIKLRSCERLLSTGIGLAGEARYLVDGAEDLLKRHDVTLEALQAWAKLVSEAP
jgi:hypothetical protein